MKRCNRKGCDFETPDINEFADHIICHLDKENVRHTRHMIDSIPDRHPYPVKCVIYLAFNVCTQVSWEAINKLLERMGYIKIYVEKESGRGVVTVTSTWTNPEETNGIYI